jgi:hypothetical protein
VKLELRDELPVLSVSVYLPAGRALPFCLRVSVKDRVPAFAVCDARVGEVLAHALEPAQRIRVVRVASALSV